MFKSKKEIRKFKVGDRVLQDYDDYFVFKLLSKNRIKIVYKRNAFTNKNAKIVHENQCSLPKGE